MALKLRVEYEGAVYHVMNRGDRREPIFKTDKDRELFLETLGQACAKTDWQVHAYCLMPNHFEDSLRLRAFKSRAGQADKAGRKVVSVWLVQLSGVFAIAVAPAIVAAGGAVAGRTWNPAGQRGGTKAVRVAHETTTR